MNHAHGLWSHLDQEKYFPRPVSVSFSFYFSQYLTYHVMREIKREES